jgi:hypothetical protein
MRIRKLEPTPLQQVIRGATTPALESAFGFIDQGNEIITGSGFMAMSYAHCAIGVVARGAEILGLNPKQADLWEEEPMLLPLTILDETAKVRGASPHEDHAGAYIEGYGQFDVDWNADRMQECYQEALREILRELDTRNADDVIRSITEQSEVKRGKEALVRV